MDRISPRDQFCGLKLRGDGFIWLRARKNCYLKIALKFISNEGLRLKSLCFRLSSSPPSPEYLWFPFKWHRPLSPLIRRSKHEDLSLVPRLLIYLILSSHKIT
jgi:hypothetical protein